MTGYPSSLRARLTCVGVVALLAVGCDSSGDAASEEAVPPDTTVVDNSAFVGCLECHAELDEAELTGRSVILTFDHLEHDRASGSVACGSCHPVETHVGTTTVKPSMDTCFNCHGADAVAPLPCATCHPLSVVPRPPSHLDTGWDTAHGIGLLDAEPACSTCHSQETFCTACHGVEMPHPVEWNEEDHVLAYFESTDDTSYSLEVGASPEEPDDGCALCHGTATIAEPRTDCDTCHHPGGDQNETWLIAHPGVVQHEGGGACFDCHDPSTCVTCHVNGVWDPAADRALFFESSEG